jgi:hypothetical protein
MLLAWTAAPMSQMFVPAGRDTLRGLPGMEVVVEKLPPELEGLGLTTAGMQSDLEQRLRAGGVAIYTTQAENPSPAKPYVYVHLNPLALPDRSLAVAVQVHVRQTLQSPVTGSQIVNAMTWEAHTVVAVPPTGADPLRATLHEMFDRLAADWRAVH